MCLIFIALNHHPKYKLVVAGNRDEVYNRKTARAQFWEDHQHIVGGRDLQAGGTWLAMTKEGRIGMVTNYRDPQNINPGAPSRGHLVSDFLINEEGPDQYLENISNNGKQYNGFNLIVGDTRQLWYYSNYKHGMQLLTPGFYGLSNHLLDTMWPKVLRGKEKIKPILESPIIDPEMLLEVLYDDQPAADEMLPKTGLTLERERALSSMFIKTEGYGSRCSTVILVDRNDEVVFTERVYDFATFNFTTETFRFALEKVARL